MNLEHENPVDKDAFKNSSVFMTRHPFSVTARQMFVGMGRSVTLLIMMSPFENLTLEKCCIPNTFFFYK